MRKFRLWALSVLLVGAFAVGSSSAWAADPVKIGHLCSLTGAYAPWMGANLVATSIAVDEVNEAGGINGRPLEIVLHDTRSTTEGAIAGWKRLVEVEQVLAVSCGESDTLLALIDESAKSKIVYMSPWAGAESLYQKTGEYLWRLVSGDQDMAVALAQMARSHASKVSVITEAGFEGTEGMARVFKPAFEKAGGTIVEDISVSPETASFRGDLDRAAGAADAILLATQPDVGLRILQEYMRRGYDNKIFVIPEMTIPEVARLGDGVLTDKIWSLGPAYNTDSATYKRFAADYEGQTGFPPTPALYEPFHYDSVITLALAAAAADIKGELTGESLRNNMRNVNAPPGVEVTSYADGLKALQEGKDINYQGASSSVDFDDYGSVLSLFAEMVPAANASGGWDAVKYHEVDPNLRP
jgi:ABC-type branched-subunit amino acid transport system substrate-binding protein